MSTGCWDELAQTAYNITSVIHSTILSMVSIYFSVYNNVHKVLNAFIYDFRAVSQPCHCWPFVLDNFLSLKFVLCIIECWTELLTPTHETLELPSCSSCENQRVSPDMAKVLCGTRCPWWRTMALKIYKQRLEKYVSRRHTLKGR